MFSTDLAAGKWTLLTSLSLLSGTTTEPANTVAARLSAAEAAILTESTLNGDGCAHLRRP
jgi:hypothetical protein